MKQILSGAVLSLAMIGPAFAGVGSPNQSSTTLTTTLATTLAKRSSFDLFAMISRPSATDCYLECKPQSGGGDGDSYTKCFNACMARK